MTNPPKLAHLDISIDGPIATVTLDRPEKRNALNDRLVEGLKTFFERPPEGVRVAILNGRGEHFSAGLDLSEQMERDAVTALHHSRWWHGVTDTIQFGGIPVVAAMHGAVVGGGLEIASSTHIRVAEESCFYALPEAQRGIYVGGGASVRVARLMGADRMAEMMLTGRVYRAAEGHTLGLSHYLVPPGQALAKARELAEATLTNAPMTNYAVLNALPRIQDANRSDGLFMESLMVALVQTAPEARARIQAFLAKQAPKSKPKDE